MTTSFRGGSFNPREFSNYVPALQGSYQGINRGFERAESIERMNDQTRINTSAAQLKQLEALSGKFNQFLAAKTKERQERQLAEGMQFYMQNGFPDDEASAYEEYETSLLTGSDSEAASANQLAKESRLRGEPADIQERYRKLSPAARLGYTIMYTQDIVSKYNPDSVNEIVNAANNTERAAALSTYQSNFFKNFNGINPAILNKYAFNVIHKTNKTSQAAFDARANKAYNEAMKEDELNKVGLSIGTFSPLENEVGADGKVIEKYTPEQLKDSEQAVGRKVFEMLTTGHTHWENRTKAKDAVKTYLKGLASGRVLEPEHIESIQAFYLDPENQKKYGINYNMVAGLVDEVQDAFIQAGNEDYDRKEKIKERQVKGAEESAIVALTSEGIPNESDVETTIDILSETYPGVKFTKLEHIKNNLTLEARQLDKARENAEFLRDNKKLTTRVLKEEFPVQLWNEFMNDATYIDSLSKNKIVDTHLKAIQDLVGAPVEYDPEMSSHPNTGLVIAYFKRSYLDKLKNLDGIDPQKAAEAAYQQTVAEYNQKFPTDSININTGYPYVPDLMSSKEASSFVVNKAVHEKKISDIIKKFGVNALSKTGENALSSKTELELSQRTFGQANHRYTRGAIAASKVLKTPDGSRYYSPHEIENLMLSQRGLPLLPESPSSTYVYNNTTKADQQNLFRNTYSKSRTLFNAAKKDPNNQSLVTNNKGDILNEAAENLRQEGTNISKSSVFGAYNFLKYKPLLAQKYEVSFDEPVQIQPVEETVNTVKTVNKQEVELGKITNIVTDLLTKLGNQRIYNDPGEALMKVMTDTFPPESIAQIYNHFSQSAAENNANKLIAESARNAYNSGELASLGETIGKTGLGLATASVTGTPGESEIGEILLDEGTGLINRLINFVDAVYNGEEELDEEDNRQFNLELLSFGDRTALQNMTFPVFNGDSN